MIPRQRATFRVLEKNPIPSVEWDTFRYALIEIRVMLHICTPIRENTTNPVILQNMSFLPDEWNELVSETDIAMMLAARFTIIRWRVKRTDVSRASFSLTMTPTLIVFTETPATNIKVERATWMTNRECDILYSPSFPDIFLSEDISCPQPKEKLKRIVENERLVNWYCTKSNPAVTG